MLTVSPITHVHVLVAALDPQGNLTRTADGDVLFICRVAGCEAMAYFESQPVPPSPAARDPEFIPMEIDDDSDPDAPVPFRIAGAYAPERAGGAGCETP